MGTTAPTPAPDLLEIEWKRKVESLLRKMEKGQEALKQQIISLKRQQNQLHGINQGDIRKAEERVKELELVIFGDEVTPGIKTQIAVMVANSESAKKHSESLSTWVKWGLTTAVALLGIVVTMVGILLRSHMH